MEKPAEDPMHWEAIVRVIIEKIGPDGLAEVIDYVVDDMAEDESLVDYAVAEQ